RYMVEWLLQNSLGFTWLCICRKNGWSPDAETVLPDLERRRAAWRAKREAGEVALDALMPVDDGLMADWKYYVPQPLPDDAVAGAPASVADVKLLDPACGSGHFLVIAFGLLARMHEEEARHRGESLSASETARRIVEGNLHGIDIDPRAIQIAAAALWLRARLHASGDGASLRLSRMNLVAPTFHLAALPKDDPARVALETELAALGVPRATTGSLVESLKGVDSLGSLLRVDQAIGALLEETAREAGPLFEHGAKQQKARLEEHVAAFLDAHAAESDLGLRLEGEQLAAGVRFVELAKEGRYDVVVGNPPYQGLSKTSGFEYVVKNYPRGKADLYAAFLERGLELVREGGLSALLTMRGWMFLGQFKELREHVLRTFDLRCIGDFDRGAFDEVPNEVLAVAAPVIRRAPNAAVASVAVQPTPFDDKSYDRQRTNRKRAAVLAQVGRYEFDPKGFAVIEGEPIVYWWTREFLGRYAAAPKLGDSARIREGLGTKNDPRYLRMWWEIPPATVMVKSFDEPAWWNGKRWVPFVKGAEGREWMDTVRDVVNWDRAGLEIATYGKSRFGRGATDYFRRGIAFTMIGANFAGRVHRVQSIFGHMGGSA
ncbi:MAG: Eco57I restriction-modification methylase domain-containing protein, partial [Solirubrobacteraceae bacterium]